MLLSLMLFPFFLRKPAVDAALDQAVIEHGLALRARDLAARAALDAEAGERAAAAALAAATAARERAAAAAEQAAARRARVATSAAARQAATPLPPPLPAPTAPAAGKPGVAIGALDLVLVMDTTGSMRDELDDVQASLLATLRLLRKLSGSLRIGFVAYKDRGEDYVTRVFPLRPVAAGGDGEIGNFVAAIRAGGGGDAAEAVDDALAAAVAMDWRADAAGRIIVIGDAPARPDGEARALAQAAAFSTSGGAAGRRRVDSIFTGGNSADRGFFQRLAAAGGGDFAQHQGRIIERVMLSIIEDPASAGTR